MPKMVGIRKYSKQGLLQLRGACYRLGIGLANQNAWNVNDAIGRIENGGYRG